MKPFIAKLLRGLKQAEYWITARFATASASLAAPGLPGRQITKVLPIRPTSSLDSIAVEVLLRP
jgi:hypothetical protein